MTEVTACPICGAGAAKGISVRTQERGTGGDRDAFECGGCGTVWLADYREDRSSVYGDDYATWGKSSGDFAEIVASAKREAFRHQLAELTPFLGDGKELLDIGTGNGYLLDVAKEKGFACWGIELSPFAASVAERRFPGHIAVGTLEESGTRDAAFDVICMTDVIEHLSAPAVFLQEVRRIAAPAALLFIITPDAASPSRRLLGRQWFQYKYEHVIYFTPRSISLLLAEHGFDVVLAKRNRKRFTLAYYAAYFRKYSFMGPVGRVAAACIGAFPRALRELPFTNPVSGEMLVIARKR